MVMSSCRLRNLACRGAFQLFAFLLSAPDSVKGGWDPLKEIPLPPNPAQVPNPIQAHHVKDQVAAEPVHHRQSEFLHNILKMGALKLGRMEVVGRVFFITNLVIFIYLYF